MFNLDDIDISFKNINLSLESDDRRKRKKVLEDLTKEFSKYKEDDVSFVPLFDGIRATLWNCLTDKAEPNRDVTIELLKMLLIKLPINNKYLEELIPIVLFKIDNNEQREASEEIRLKLLELLEIILEKYIDNIQPYCNEIIQALSISLIDKYAKARQQSCKCVIILSQIGGQCLYENSVKLVKPILTSFKHNHSKTRICAIEALGAIMKNANWKNVDAQTLFGSLGERLFDDVPSVRLAVAELVGTWLVEQRDRYSFFYRLVPLMLSCLSDPQPEVSEKAWTMWSAAGTQYLKENEQDLKDRLDFLEQKPLHYPKNVERPNLGCRTLIHRNTVQITTPLLKELTDWQPGVCVKASALLAMLILHAEDDLTQHTETLLETMYRIAENKGNDIPPECIANIEKAAEYMGMFLSSDTWTQLVLPVVSTDPNPGNLYILSALLRGCPPGSMDTVAERLSAILADPDICESLKMAMQLETLKCCRALLTNVSFVNEITADNLTGSLYQIIAATHFDSEREVLAAAGKEKANVTIESLTERNLPNLVKPLKTSVLSWTPAHAHFRLFLFLLDQPASTWFLCIDDIKMILKVALELDKGDAKVQSYIFAKLAANFEKSDVREKISDQDFNEFTLNVVNGLIIPNLTWRAGLTAESLRTIVLACLFCVLKSSSMKLQTDVLASSLVACLRDSPTENRKIAMQNLGLVLEKAGDEGDITNEIFTNTYPQVVDRLDDVSSDVRNEGIAVLTTLLKKLPANITESTHGAIFGHLVNAILPYLDDDCENFRISVCGALKIIGEKAPKVLQEKVKNRVHLFKSQDLCQELLNGVPGEYV